MKTILVPTDFSENAGNAMRYAIELAKQERARIVLVHAFDLTQVIPYTSGLFVANDIQSIEKNAVAGLEQACSEIQNSKIECEYLNTEGAVVSVILHTIGTINPDLVVMGTKGAGGIKEMLLGTNTAAVMEQAQCPVIGVPEKAVFKGIRKISYAADYQVCDLDALKALTGIAGSFQAGISILHISDNEQNRVFEESCMEEFKKKVKKTVGFEPLSFKLEFGLHVQDVLEKYIDAESPDLLAMSIRHRTLLEKICGRSVTKQMMFHSHVPLLAFPGKRKETASVA
jgi:nucleotide-binding universal stress UspA family protein